jgi:hypothetical protein
MLGMATTTLTGTLANPITVVVRQASPPSTWWATSYGPLHVNGSVMTLVWRGPTGPAADAAIAAASARPMFPR